MLSESQFSIDIPTRIRFGWGSRMEFTETLAQLANKRVLIVASERMLQRAPVALLLQALEKSNLELLFSTRLRPNPRVQDIESCAASFSDSAVDHVLGIGGGSGLDQAKVIAMALGTGQSVVELLSRKSPLPERGLPLTLMPTTSGTGSEISWGAIISDEEAGVKTGLRGRTIAADFAYIDPELTVTAPTELTMITGFDVLTHSLETFLSNKASPLTKALSRQAMRNVFIHLPRLKENGDDRESRSAMAYSSALMGINLCHSSTCLPHRLQYPVGAATDTSHAEGLAALYPAWLNAVRPFATDKLARCAAWIGVGSDQGQERDADTFIATTLELIDKIGMNRTISQLGVNEDMVRDFVDQVSGNLSLDPSYESKESLRTIYLKSL